MSILIFALVVCLILALVVWAVQAIPVPAPLNWVIPLIAIIIGIVLIASRAGLM